MSLVDLKEKLQAASKADDTDRMIDILTQLKKVGVTAKLLQTSQAGVLVGKLRKSGTAEVSKLAKDVVLLWKGALTPKKVSSESKVSKPAVQTVKAEPMQAGKAESMQAGKAVTPQASANEPSAAGSSPELGTVKAKDFSLGRTNEQIRSAHSHLQHTFSYTTSSHIYFLRDAVQKQFYASIEPKSEQIAFQIEEALFRKYSKGALKKRIIIKTLQYNAVFLSAYT